MFEEIFLESLRKQSLGSWAQRLDFFYQAETSYFMDLSSIQDSFRFRARYLAWKIANLLISEKGDLQRDLLADLVQFFAQHPFILGPRREGDSLIHAHLLTCLQQLIQDPQIWVLIRKFSAPVCHKRGEEVIRETLWPTAVETIESFHVRRAALASWLTLLRQAVGSCFATAPAILIQKQPYLFFKDLYEILNTGQLKRVLSGKEYAVPLSPTSGKMDLEKILTISERVSFSPGLVCALEAANLLPYDLFFMKKIEQVQKCIALFKGEKTIEVLISDLILNSIGLNSDDILEEERLAKIQMTSFFKREGAIYYERPTLRAQKIADWKKRCAKAKTAFQALTECSLLRTWEYTIASLSDVKVDFAKWNLYLGLGLNLEEKGGIGEFLYQKIDAHLQICNEKIVKSSQEYESATSQVYTLESLSHRSASDAQRYQFRGELAVALHAVQRALETRDQWIAKAQALSGFFSILIHFYAQKLIFYFQEIFDPFVAASKEDFIEDSPAGFRLLYKHGRADASLWTLIYSPEEYIESLRLFFSAVENEINPPEALRSSFVSEITTELIQFIQEPSFLIGSMDRARSYDKATPWDYISGGSMQSLVQAYAGKDLPFTEISFFPKSEEDLLQVLLQLKKELKKSVLIHSPTHAFILHLDRLSEKTDEWLIKYRSISNKWSLNEEKQECLAHLFSERLNVEQRALFLHRFRQQITAETKFNFRSNLLDSLQNIEEVSSSAVDSFLYENTSVLENLEIKEALHSLLNPLCELHSFSSHKMTHLIEQLDRPFMSSFELIQTAKWLLLQLVESPLSNIDWDQELASQARALHLCYPHPLFFADTNWSGWFFGFIVSPLTDRLELWRLSRTGLQGVPMSDWNIWFSAENQIPWAILSRPEEYNINPSR